MKHTIDKNILKLKSIIYYLYDGDRIVYIGESGVGIKRCFQHTNKKYTHIEFEEASANVIFRKNHEAQLIIKYKPKYNKQISKIKPGYINTDNIRKKLKDYGRYDITNKLRVLVKQNCRYYISDGNSYVNLSDIEQLLILKFNQKI